jgi:hypothetical protein
VPRLPEARLHLALLDLPASILLCVLHVLGRSMTGMTGMTSMTSMTSIPGVFTGSSRDGHGAL